MVGHLLEFQTLRGEEVLDDLNAEFSFYEFWVAATLFVSVFGPAWIMVKCLG